MEADHSMKEGPQSLQSKPDLAHLSWLLNDAQSVIEKIKQKRKRQSSSRTVIEALQKQRNAAVDDKNRELERINKKVREDELRRHRESVEAAVAHSGELKEAHRHFEKDRGKLWLQIGTMMNEKLDMEEELDSIREVRNIAEAEIESMREENKIVETNLQKALNELNDNLASSRMEKNRLETALETTQRSLQHLTEDKQNMELGLQEELWQANLHRQESNSVIADNVIQKCKVERELADMREDHNRLKISLDTVQNNLVEEKEKRLKLEEELVTFREDHNRLKNDLKEEEDKQLCGICLQSPKDAICLPCVHADYCFGCLEKHRKKSRTCPTCRTVLSGVLKSDIDS